LKTPPVFWPLLLYVRAGVHARLGRPADALALLEQALEIVGPRGLDPMAADMCRLKGELLLASGESAETAEPWFRRALDIARSRDERTLTLRAAVGLHRLLGAQGRGDEGRRLLQEAYDALPEGRSTVDAREAAALLAR
jgi:tetratricopeptide (TPR) repeat protein